MRSTTRWMSSAAVGGLVLLCVSSVAAQSLPHVRAVAHVASVAPGAILGTVLDERGAPVVGAMISALGATTALAISDRAGRFEMRTLSPGPYLVRAHLSGFIASRGQMVDVRPNARASSAIALRHASPTPSTPAYPILAAGLGAAPDNGSAAADDADAAAPSSNPVDDHSEIAWRLRHLRRGILKDATVPDEILVRDTPPDQTVFSPGSFMDRAVGSPARFTSGLFAGTPFSGQVNLLTTGSFETPQQLFSANNFSRSAAYLALGAPVGDSADWTMRAALTQGDLTSWILAGEYTTRTPATHRYDLGLSYSTQRYDGGNFAALRSVTDGSRNAGAVYAFDTFTITPSITLTYGGRYARYDYLDESTLISPRVSLTLEPVDHFRISGVLSQRALAPGAEEFMPRDSGVWLPPQRTFSSLNGRPLEAERGNHVEVGVERDIAQATVSVRAFRQEISDQMVTVFGLDLPGTAASLGHYFIGNAGDLQATGVGVGVRAAIAGRVHGSVEYSVARTQFTSPDDAAYMLVFAPYASHAERIHDVAAAIETNVPETSTRVVVLYRVSNAFARPAVPEGQTGAPPVAQLAADRAPIDSRFDVQVRQSLPFMDFSTAKWEMLIGVRNFFRETATDQSVYDELLVVRPPKRIVGGLTLKF